MKDFFAKCGMNCRRCPTYKENLKTQEDRERCSEGWKKYYGFKLSPEKLLLCDGCQTPDEEKPVRYLNCIVRKCAVKNDVKTCAHCTEFPCKDVPSVSVAEDIRSKTASRLGGPVPEEDYILFMEPYIGMKHLKKIRASLAPEVIKEMIPMSHKPRIVEFPEDLAFPEEKKSAYKALHRIMSSVETAEGISYARLENLKKRRQQMLKILWAFGLYGEPDKENDSNLILEGERYLSQKLPSYPLEKIKDILKVFDKYGLECELVPLIESGWHTPKGGLRKKGWILKMSVKKDTGDALLLNALQEYAADLEKKHGAKAFSLVSRADMRIYL
jgi:hypothetical protein